MKGFGWFNSLEIKLFWFDCMLGMVAVFGIIGAVVYGG